MKAIFAVSALAAAISAQAIAADTEITTSTKGSVDVYFMYNMQPEEATSDVNLYPHNDNSKGYDLNLEYSVKNGPFSGKVALENKEKDNGQTVTVKVKDLKITDGKISFGQVGKLKDTDKYVKVVDDMTENTSADIAAVDGAFRVAVTDELKVQLQGNQADTSVGVAAQYKASADALSYVAEAQVVSESGNDDAFTFFGAGVTYKADAVEVKAALNNTSEAGVSVTEYAALATVKAAGATVKAGYQDFSTDVEKDEKGLVEVSYGMGSITLSAGYEYTAAEDAGDKPWGKVAYSEGANKASAKVSIGNFDAETADEALIEIEASHKTESGITYYGEYDLQSDSKNAIKVGAKYSF